MSTAFIKPGTFFVKFANDLAHTAELTLASLLHLNEPEAPSN